MDIVNTIETLPKELKMLGVLAMFLLVAFIVFLLKERNNDKQKSR